MELYYRGDDLLFLSNEIVYMMRTRNDDGALCAVDIMYNKEHKMYHKNDLIS